MTTINEYYEQAQLSVAAYAMNLMPGISGAHGTPGLHMTLIRAQSMGFRLATWSSTQPHSPFRQSHLIDSLIDLSKLDISQHALCCC